MGIRADAIAVLPLLFSDTNEGVIIREDMRKAIRREYKKGVLDVMFDKAADGVRHREEEGVDWANMPADSPKFRFAVAQEVVAFLYETS